MHFGRCFYPQWFTVHWRYTCYQFMHSLGVEPMTLPLRALSSTVMRDTFEIRSRSVRQQKSTQPWNVPRYSNPWSLIPAGDNGSASSTRHSSSVIFSFFYIRYTSKLFTQFFWPTFSFTAAQNDLKLPKHFIHERIHSTNTHKKWPKTVLVVFVSKWEMCSCICVWAINEIRDPLQRLSRFIKWK